MWVVTWETGCEPYNSAEEARFIYFILRSIGFTPKIEYQRTYLG